MELDSFHVSLVNGLVAEGKGLRIWPPAQVVGSDCAGLELGRGALRTKPLIQLEDFRFHAPLRYEPGKPIKISAVELKGLDRGCSAEAAFHACARAEASEKPGKATAEL